MADILALVLKHNSAQTQGLKNFSFTSGTGWNTSPCMIVGERCGIKTSLLFLAAVTAASELGVKVLFLTPTPIQKLPAPLQDSLANLNPDGLKKIKFMYPRSQEELLQDVASLHESACGSAAPPSLLIVDGLERYLGAGPGAGTGPGGSPQGDGWLAVAHISALLVDTAAFLGRKLEERGGAGASCRVLVSFDTERQGHAPGELPAQDPVLSVLDRYFPVRATLDRDRSAAAPPPRHRRRAGGRLASLLLRRRRHCRPRPWEGGRPQSWAAVALGNPPKWRHGVLVGQRRKPS
ncbi:ATPase SWSAP1 [Anguilla anguilla]|uniref:ATPase SWSAP1 n=1 Tax=Anguilla anguilla TaxID=7936 RepID=UPI0015ACD054|nr:ATPase SWSAP1 [Anguilla anguilla]